MASKSYREFAASIIQILEALNITYAIGGSFASIAYGEARTTADIDISLDLSAADVRRLEEAIQKLDYYISSDAIHDAIANRTSFNVIDGESGYKADLFIMESTALAKSALARRRRVAYDSTANASAILYSPEDVIVYKLKYYLQGQSQKHLRDIAAILIVQGNQLDYEYVGRWADEIAALDVWNQLFSEYTQKSSRK